MVQLPAARIVNPRNLKDLQGAIANSRHQLELKINEVFNLVEVFSAHPTIRGISSDSTDQVLVTLAGPDGELVAQAEQNSHPVWIISHPSGTARSPLIMYANSAALEANHKRAEDLIGEPYLQLWQPDSLREVVRRLWAPRTQLTEYETRGFRFSDSPWDRVAYRFFANYRRVNFMASPCWQEEILGAEPY